MADVADKKSADAAAADAAAAKSSKKKRDHEVHPDEESEFPWGKVERKKGEVDQVHAFKVFGTKYVSFFPQPRSFSLNCSLSRSCASNTPFSYHLLDSLTLLLTVAYRSNAYLCFLTPTLGL